MLSPRGVVLIAALVGCLASVSGEADVLEREFLTNAFGSAALDQRISARDAAGLGSVQPVRIMNWTVAAADCQPGTPATASTVVTFTVELSPAVHGAELPVRRPAVRRRLASRSQLLLPCSPGNGDGSTLCSATQVHMLLATDGDGTLAVLYTCHTPTHYMLLATVLVWEAAARGWQRLPARGETLLLRGASTGPFQSPVHYVSQGREAGSQPTALAVLRGAHGGGGRLVRLALRRGKVLVESFTSGWLPRSARHTLTGACYSDSGRVGGLVWLDEARLQSVFQLFSISSSQAGGGDAAVLLSEADSYSFPDSEPALLAACGLGQRLVFADCRLDHVPANMSDEWRPHWLLQLTATAHTAIHSTQAGHGGAEWVSCGTALFEAVIHPTAERVLPVVAPLRRAGAALTASSTAGGAIPQRVWSRRCQHDMAAWWRRETALDPSQLSCRWLRLSPADLTPLLLLGLPAALGVAAVLSLALSRP